MDPQNHYGFLPVKVVQPKFKAKSILQSETDLLEDRRFSMDPAPNILRNIIMDFSSNQYMIKPQPPISKYDLPFIIAKRNNGTYLTSEKNLSNVNEYLSTVRPNNCTVLKPQAPKDALQNYLIEGYGIKGYSPQIKHKYNKFKRASEFCFDDVRPISREQEAMDTDIRGVINLLRENAFQKYSIPNPNKPIEAKIIIDTPIPRLKNPLDLQIQRVQMIQNYKKKEKPIKMLHVPKSPSILSKLNNGEFSRSIMKNSKRNAQCDTLKQSKTLENNVEKAREILVEDHSNIDIKKAQDDSGLKEIKRKSVVNMLKASATNNINNNGSLNKKERLLNNARNNNQHSNNSPEKRTNSPFKNAKKDTLPALDEKLDKSIQQNKPSDTVATSPRKHLTSKKIKMKLSQQKRKSVSRTACRKRENAEVAPTIERIKQKSKPMFLPHDYDYTVFL